MSLTRHTMTYRCWNDCQPEGCPGHEASLEYQSVSDVLTFDNGKGSQISMQLPELEVFLRLFELVADSSVEINDIFAQHVEPLALRPGEEQ